MKYMDALANYLEDLIEYTWLTTLITVAVLFACLWLLCAEIKYKITGVYPY
jgi:uncharacterized membrane protein required for colicin V production